MNEQPYITTIQTPVVTAGAYSANDVVGGLITFDVSSAGGAGYLQAVYLEDSNNQSMALNVWLFNEEPQTIADNGAFATAVTIATLKKRIWYGQIAAGDWTSINSLAFVTKDISPVRPYTTSNNLLYAYFVCTGTPTLAATCLSLRLGVYAV